VGRSVSAGRGIGIRNSPRYARRIRRWWMVPRGDLNSYSSVSNCHRFFWFKESLCGSLTVTTECASAITWTRRHPCRAGSCLVRP